MATISVNYDLHTHSTASDGTLKPSQLVELAVASRVGVLALTDHDTIAGVTEAMRSANSFDIKLIPGVEISATWERQVVHLVGLGVNIADSQLLMGLQGIATNREARAKRIGEKLAACGIEGAYAGAREIAGGSAIARPHFARYLVQQRVVADTQTAFKRFLVRNRPAYVAGCWASFAQGVEWIVASGGQAVVAHPARYRMTRSKLRRMLAEFKSLGGSAIEVVSGTHSRDETQAMARYAREFDLAASAGSDFHGPERSWSKLGGLPPLPADLRPVWDEWR
ncbi:MAG: PHP domain-containing protein [Gammaproteobacteria bacterium]|nr:PHP domain-containing protein [Gammaproteobacteria bacterium]